MRPQQNDSGKRSRSSTMFGRGYCSFLLLLVPAVLPADDFIRILQSESTRPGFCVVLGCATAEPLLESQLEGKFLVQGLCADGKTKVVIRKELLSKRALGAITVARTDDSRLPYTNNLVNAIVVLEQGKISREEILRVTAPYGVALFKVNGKWEKITKPYPEEMDEWAQPRHSASRATVSTDQLVGPPTQLQWLNQEKYDRENLTQLLSAGGRNFYVFSNGIVVARDAFNGTRLWDQENGPPIWAATKDYLCTTIGGKLATIDAASGEIHRTDVPVSRDCAWDQGVVYTANGAYSLAKKEFIWKNEEPKSIEDAPLVADGKVVVVTSPRRPNPEIICRSAKTGKDLWRIPSLGTVAFAYRGKLFIEGKHQEETVRVRNKDRRTDVAVNHCLNLDDGKTVWTIRYYLPGHHGSSTMFCVGDTVWVRPGKLGASMGQDEFWRSYDLETGEKIKEIPAIQSMHRCYEPRATERFILASGIDYLDLQSDKVHSFRGARGDCNLGTTPANGMMYSFPNMCMCMGQVNGVSGLSSHSLDDPAERALQLSSTLERGPAYRKIRDVGSVKKDLKNWLTLRGSHTRRGANGATLPRKLDLLWEKRGRLMPSSPVVKDSAVYIALRDVNAVTALAASDGKHRWTFRAEGPVDSPPTLAGDAVVFGSEDGWIYVLCAADGKLAWRFRAAPEQRVILANGRPTSAWPLHGSLLVENGIVYAVAGHHNELDGGLFTYALEIKTGKVLWKKRLIKEGVTQEIPMSSQGHTGNNLLASDGTTLYMELLYLDMQSGEIQKKHQSGKRFYMGGYADQVVWGGPQGYLLDLSRPAYSSGHSSSNWIWGNIRANMIAVEDDLAYGIITLHGKDQKRYKDKPLFQGGPAVVFCSRKSDTKKAWSEYIPKDSLVWKHSLPEGCIARTVIKTADQVLVGCQLQTSTDSTSGLILQLDPTTGEEIGRFEIDSPPRWDGLSAAQDRLFLVTEDRQLMCLGAKE